MLWWVAQTTLIAGALAVLATLTSRWKRLGPEARHALWLVVLIKLALPPVVAWPWRVPDRWPSSVEPAVVAVAVPSRPAVIFEPLAPSPPLLPPPVELPPAEPLHSPRIEAEVPPPVTWIDPPSPEPEAVPAPRRFASESPLPEMTDLKSVEPSLEVSDPEPIPSTVEIAPLKAPIWNLEFLILGAWFLGSLVVIVRRTVKIAQFGRSLAKTIPAPDWLVEETRAIGDRVGVRPPPVAMTTKVMTPLLWCLGRPRLILPEALVERLEADRWSGILAHELAHLARRDHWVVRLELLVEAAWWWNPLFWHVRRKLHEEAELACDARVIRSLPERRYAYAEALVDVCEHLARTAIPAPALGVGGAGASRSLEGRLLMILRDPIPRRPSRATALAAILLAALALPAWTLGQQQPEPPKGETPATTLPVAKPDESKPRAPQPLPPGVKPSPEAAEATIADIKAAQGARLKSLKNLSFRYVVASRERNARKSVGQHDLGGGIGPYLGNMGGGGGMMSIPPQGFGPPAASSPIETTVRVQVADVSLALGNRSKVDLFEALIAEPPAPGEAAPGFAWDRQFVAKDGSGIMELETDSTTPGAVPFQWIWENQHPEQFIGDSLGAWMTSLQAYVSKPDSTLDPLDPRPENLLDLAGSTTLLLQTDLSHAEVVGVDLIDGQEAVRVAWIAKQWGIRGICWFAPKLGFAPIRIEATRDPIPNSRPNFGRLAWWKQASEFTKVGDYWLPGKVAYEESEANPNGGEPVYRNELRIAFEDFKVNPANPPASAFRPKLAIQGLDDKTGQFTALPPEVSAGLVDRLQKAVRESPFGPPSETETTRTPVEPPKAAVVVDPQLQPENVQKAGPALTPVPFLPDGSKAVGPAPPDAAKADPGIIAPPKAGFEDPIPVIEPKTNDPIAVKAPEPRLEFAPNNSPMPARAAVDPLTVAPDSVKLLQARRNGKAAELRKAEARKALVQAVVARNEALIKKDPNYVSREDKIKAEGELAIADAEVKSKMEELAEAEINLANAKQPSLPSLPLPKPNESPTATVSTSLAELRDAVELMEVQLLGKQTEFRGAEAKVQIFKQAGPKLNVEFGVARAEVEQKKIEVQEYEIRLKQARRRVEAEEARLKGDLQRAKDRLSWSEEMLKKRNIPAATAQADRLTYDWLMLQLVPKYVPAMPPGDNPAPKPEAEALPALDLKVTAEKVRFSGQTNEYKIRVSNPGTVAATEVKVAATLPRQGGKLIGVPTGAKFAPQSRRLIWSFPRIDPGQAIDMAFPYQMSTPGLYRAEVEATFDEDFKANDAFATEVKAIDAIDLKISQTQRVIAVGKTMHYDIEIKNSGTREATKLQLAGKLTKNLQPIKAFNIREGEFVFNPETGECLWPTIDRLGAGQSLTLSLEVKATASGPAGYHLFLGHSEMAPDNAKIEDVISTTVVAPK